MGEPRSLTRPFNGKTGEVLRWLIGGLVVALISYFTSLGAQQERMAKLESKQDAQYEAIQRSLQDLKSDVSSSLLDVKTDIRDLRGAVLKPVGGR